LPPGALVAGTAQVTVNGNDLGKFHAVQCSPAGPFLTISTGNDQQGTAALVSSTDGLTAKWVKIRDLGGFTGSFNEGLGGNATVSLDGATYTITGSADGFDTDNPSFRSTGTFTIKAAC
jgi:ipoprotein LpqH